MQFYPFCGAKCYDKKMFMIIKLDVASSAVSPYNTISSLRRLNLQVLIYCYMHTNFNDRNRWLHSILQPVEFHRSTKNPVRTL